MEALKLIPQSFFDFLARLVPGALALAILLDTNFGGEHWRLMLDTFAAGMLSKENVTALVVITATMTAYVGGQLAAPFGKAMQRIAEAIAAIPEQKQPVPTNVAPDTLFSSIQDGPRPPKLGKLTPKTRSQRVKNALWPVEETSEEIGNYDWLRVNAPEIGALVAKIRAEQTMFFSMSAVACAAAIMEFMLSSWVKGFVFIVLGLSCEMRGYTVGRTLKQTSGKLTRACKAKMQNDALRPENGS